MNIDTYWHILWTVYPMPMPNQQTKTISGLYDFYKKLEVDGIKYEVSQPLNASTCTSNIKPDRPILNPHSVEDDIKKLTSEKGDRIAGNIPVIDLLVDSNHIELFVKFNGDNLIQKIARLKSRSATLLSFSSESGEGGKHTWSKGIWYGKSTDIRFVPLVKNRIMQLKNASF
ncbi:MAG: hypothetical protein AAFO95_22565 [Cyanobacteria bacterium J06600_6]